MPVGSLVGFGSRTWQRCSQREVGANDASLERSELSWYIDDLMIKSDDEQHDPGSDTVSGCYKTLIAVANDLASILRWGSFASDCPANYSKRALSVVLKLSGNAVEDKKPEK